MLGDINKNLEVQPYQLILCKPDRTQIAILSEAYEFTYTSQFLGIDEIDFKIPYFVLQDHKKVKNPNWDKLHGDYLVLIKQGTREQYFIIDTPQNIGDEGTKEKVVHGFSLEYELGKKMVRSYQESDGKPKIVKLYDYADPNKGIMNYLTTLTSWSINYIDADLLNTWRSFQIDESTWLEVAYEIQESFQCVFVYNTVNKSIDILPIERIGQNRGLFITEENYITKFDEEFKHDEIVTRLYPYGKDNLTIHEVNPTGEGYIEDFSFFRTSKYMSEGLLVALDNYDSLVVTKKGEFDGYLDDLNTYNTQLYGDGTSANIGLYGDLSLLQDDMQIILDNIDLAIKRGDNTALATYNSQKSAKQMEIDNKKAEIDVVKTNIQTTNNNIINLKNQLSKEVNFTHEQIVELDFFIRERTWSDSNYYDVNELYNDAKKHLVKLSQPPIEFSLSLVDFLQIVKCQHDWNKLRLGDIVNIQYSLFNTDIQVRLIAYTHDVDGANLQLTFSNKDSVDDPAVYLNEVLQQAVSTSTSLDMSRFKWDRSEDNQNMIRQILEGEWDSAKNRVLAGRNQEIILDDRGISLTDSTDPNSQLRMVNNVIAMTTDGWNSTKLAITPQGVFAERLIGQIIAGENLIITNGSSNVVIDGNGLTVSGGAITITDNFPYVDNKVDELEGKMSSLFVDGEVTLLEAKDLRNILTQVRAEMNDLITKGKNVGVITVTDGSDIYSQSLATLENVLSPFIVEDATTGNLVQSSYPITMTSTQRVDVNNALQDIEIKSNDLAGLINEKYTQDNSVMQGQLYNGVKIDTTNGFVATRSDDKARTIVNATDGIKIQGRTSTANAWTDNFYADLNGDLVINNLQLNGGQIKNSLGQVVLDVSNGVLKLDNLSVTGKITAENIDVTNLYVGTGGITLDSSATISWSQVTSQPTILDENTVTTISQNEISTATIRANQIVMGGTNGSISFGDLSNKPFIPSTASDVGARPNTWTPSAGEVGAISSTYIDANGIWTGYINAGTITTGTLTGRTVQTASSGSRVVMTSNFADTYWYSGSNLAFRIYDGVDHVSIGNFGALAINVTGTWNFSGATVNGLGTTAKFK